MSAHLTANAYGKSRVRLTHVTRHPDRHDLKELAVAVRLEGDFAMSYTEGDNSTLVATDSIKNTVYVLARRLGVPDVETFGDALARHFLQEYPQVTRTTIELQESRWQRIVTGGEEHRHAFVGGNSETRTCTVTATHKAVRIESGIDGLLVLKTTDSGFVGFVRDKYTTLGETTDRIFATIVTATWTYGPIVADWDGCHARARQTLLDVFATHKSRGVQETLFAMGEAVLAACREIDEIRLTMPNKHRIPISLAAFGLDNPNEVFVATDEPHGLIEGTIRRA